MNIKEIRKLENLSQKEFSDKYKLNIRSLQNWEQGRYKIPDLVLNNILDKHNSDDDLKRIKNINFFFKNTFKICIDKPFKNCDRIYPIQQKKVSSIIDDTKNNSNVLKIIIFGSSVTYNCHQGSDVDIYFELKDDRSPLHKSYNFDYDYWDNYRVDENLKKEIFAKGVVVYER